MLAFIRRIVAETFLNSNSAAASNKPARCLNNRRLIETLEDRNLMAYAVVSDPFYVPVQNGNWNQGNYTLEQGVEYMIRVSGSFNMASDHRAGDAEYYVPQGGSSNGAWSDQGTTGSHNFGVDVKWGAANEDLIDHWGEYQASHVYTTTAIGNGTKFETKFADSNYSDNFNGTNPSSNPYYNNRLRVEILREITGDLDLVNPNVADADEFDIGRTQYVGQKTELKIAALNKFTATGDFKIGYDPQKITLYNAAGAVIGNESIVTQGQSLFAMADAAGEAIITLNYAESSSTSEMVDRVKINVLPANVWIAAADASSEISIDEGDTLETFRVYRNYIVGAALDVVVQFGSDAGAQNPDDYEFVVPNGTVTWENNAWVWRGSIPANDEYVGITITAYLDAENDDNEDLYAELILESSGIDSTYEVGYAPNSPYGGGTDADNDPYKAFAVIKNVVPIVNAYTDSDNNGVINYSDWEDELESSEYALGVLIHEATYKIVEIQLPKITRGQSQYYVSFNFTEDSDVGQISVKITSATGVLQVVSGHSYRLSEDVLGYNGATGKIIVEIHGITEKSDRATLKDVEGQAKPNFPFAVNLRSKASNGPLLGEDSVKYLVAAPNSFYDKLQHFREVGSLLASRGSYDNVDLKYSSYEKLGKEDVPASIKQYLYPEEGQAISGFSATMYKNYLTPDKAGYVIAFRGTDTDSISAWVEDMWDNILQGLGYNADQYIAAKDIGNNLRGWEHADSLVYTGHSLGGGLASAAAVMGGRPADTFNAAGLLRTTIAGTTEAELNYDTAANLIQAFSVDSDLLTLLQQTVEKMQEAIGTNRTQWLSPYGAPQDNALWLDIGGEIMAAQNGEQPVLWATFKAIYDLATNATDRSKLIKSHGYNTLLYCCLGAASGYSTTTAPMNQ